MSYDHANINLTAIDHRARALRAQFLASLFKRRK